MSEQFHFGPAIEGYFSYLLEVRRLAPRSVVDMRCTLKQVIIAMGGIRPGKELWQLSLDDYLIWMEQARRSGKKVRTLAKDISHLRSLIDYAWRSGKADRNVLDGFKLRDLSQACSIVPKVLTVDQAKQLIAACPRKTALARRDRMMVLLLYGCGLRTGELCNLDVPDINIERQELLIKKAKGDIQRCIPVPEGVWTELLAFLTERKGKRGALFRTSAKCVRIKDHDALLAVHSSAIRAGVGGWVVPKTLRHSYATHLMDAGVDLGTIASLMGHRSPNESGVYLHALPGNKEAAVERLSANSSASNDNTKKEGVK